MKDLFSKAVKLSNIIFGEGKPATAKTDIPNPDKKEWSFGSKQAKVIIQNGQLSWSLLGNGGSSYPLSSVRGIQYEKGSSMAFMSHFIVLASGGDNRRVMIPKSDNSEKVVASINEFINAFHEKPHTAKQEAGTSDSIADELAKLANLKQQGILTEEEFQQQKQRLLNR